jgi:hypothetical protein
MPSQVLTSVENNFTKGLITESTGLNFPENAATDTDNCEYTLIGDVLRREGIDLEENFGTQGIARTNSAISTYKWNNAGGDGNTQLMAVQIGGAVYFYNITAATVSSPLSAHFLGSSILLVNFAVAGSTVDITSECTYTDGNGFLFILHPSCEPIYCSYASGVVTGNLISIQIRDFVGLTDNLPVNTRPITTTNKHIYNLMNQGWTTSPPWSATTNAASINGTGIAGFSVSSGLTITIGQLVTAVSSFGAAYGTFSGAVTAYAGTNLTINVLSYTPSTVFAPYVISPASTGYITAWTSAEGNFPSNADVWWRFKNASGVFDPTTTQPNVTLSSGQAPQGHFFLSAFNMNRNIASGFNEFTTVSTTARPTIGAWFQGRVWYAGVNASYPAASDVAAYSWSENIYFSQVNLNTTTNFGSCYQVNDATSEDLNGILPTDGGIITIQGCGRIFKLFPVQNGMLVFAANGVWFITGSQGIGFAANDYTITKLSNIESISSTSFVDVMGLPYFWNEEGIYQVVPQQSGGLTVNPITVGTILSFYNNIPKQSKKYVRGAYNNIDYVIQWIYKSSNETSVLDRYSFDKIMNYNVYNKAFFPYSVDISNGTSINGINYVQAPGGSTSPDPAFKYFCSVISGVNTSISFADEHDDTFVDWRSAILNGVNFVSYFITGYKLHGQGQRRFQMPYIYVYNKMTGDSIGYNIQGIWDYASDRNSNRWSMPQTVLVTRSRFDNIVKRHRIRGQGLVLQLKVYSVDGQPFDIMGWSVFEQQNTGV